MPVIGAGNIVAARAGEADYHTDMADTDLRLVPQLGCCEQPVDVVSAFYQYLFLLPAPPAGCQEMRNILKGVVERRAIARVGAHGGRDDFAMFQRRAILNSHHRDPVAVDYHRVVTMARGDQRVQRADLVVVAERNLMRTVFGQHDKLGRIDGVGRGAQNAPLRTGLAAIGQKCDRLARVGIGRPGRQRLSLGVASRRGFEPLLPP
jgi:hypothetical protein